MGRRWVGGTDPALDPVVAEATRPGAKARPQRTRGEVGPVLEETDQPGEGRMEKVSE